MQQRKHEKNEDLTDIFREEVKKIGKELGENPIRRIPKRVILADVKVEMNIRSGVREEGGDLLISNSLSRDKVSTVIKREAFILFLPEVDFPHIYDLAWAYANSDPAWWAECTLEVNIPTMPRYLAPEIFQSYGKEGRSQIVRSITKSILFMYRQRPDRKIRLKDYLLLVTIARRYPSIRLSKRELQVLKSLVHVVRSGDAKLENLARHTGLSLASISRAVRDLISKGIVHGPYVIYPPRIGLATYLMELVEPSEEEIEFIENFPFTYTAYITTRNLYYISFLIPFKYEGIFSKIRGKGMRLGRAEGFSFDLHSLDPIEPEQVLELMVKGYTSQPDTPLEWRDFYRPRKPPTKLDGKDMLALSIINIQGKASRSYLRRIGVPNAAERFAKYRRYGIVVKGYFPTGVGLGEAFLVRFNAPYRDFLRIRAALAKVSSLVMFYTDGELHGITSIILVNEKIMGTVMKSLQMLFSDAIERMEHLVIAGPSNWQLPVDLWNEEEQTFEVDIHSFLRVFSSRIDEGVWEDILRRLH